MLYLTTKKFRHFYIASILIITLPSCASEDSAVSGNTQRSTVGVSISATEALVPCKNLAKETEDLEELVEVLTTLADNGEPCAQYGLGSLYRLGYDTVPSNSDLAQMYLLLAANQGYPDAQRELDAM